MHTRNATLPSETSLLIAGVVRNGVVCLTRSVRVLVAASEGFQSVQKIIVESDSGDEIVEVLTEEAAGSPNFDIVALGKTTATGDKYLSILHETDIPITQKSNALARQ